jgi:peptide/nickel transport system permease protein
MWRYVAKRSLLVLFVVFGVTLITFSMMHLAPGDPAESIALARYGQDLTPEQVELVRAEEALDAPIHEQYLRWLSHILELDMGNSLIDGDDVLEEISERFPATLQLAFASLLLSLAIAIPAGVISAVRKNTLIDGFVSTTALLGVSIPNFWLGLLLIWFFGLYLDVLPTYGYGGVSNLILPMITLGTSMAAISTRLMRSSMLEVMTEDYIDTAKAKGLDEWTVVVRHGLRNALLPVVTFAGLQFGVLIGGTVIVESIFAWPGIGTLLIDAVYARDYAMIQGCVLIIGLFFALITLAVDIAYLFLDPRIRYESSD